MSEVTGDSVAQRLLEFLVRHYQETEKKGVYMTQAELADATGLQVEELTTGLRALVNAGLVGVYGNTRYGAPYVHLTGATVGSITTTIFGARARGNHERKKGTCIPGVQGVQPRTHFLEAVACVRDVFTHQEISFSADAANVEITFGQFRRRVDLRIMQNRPGLSYSEFRSTLDKAWELIGQKLNRRVELFEFRVVNLHLSIDFLGLRLDGVKSVTLEAYDHWLARLYNKGSVLRSEAVLSGGVVTLDQALSMMQRGFLEFGMLKDIHNHLLKEKRRVAG